MVRAIHHRALYKIKAVLYNFFIKIQHGCGEHNMREMDRCKSAGIIGIGYSKEGELMAWIEEVNAAYQEKLKKMNLPAETIDLSVLSGRQREALRMRYEEKLSFKAIGEHLGVSLERARQIVNKAFIDMHWAGKR